MVVQESRAGEFRFRHALVHEARYAAIAAERRRELHARVVRALERGGQTHKHLHGLAYHAWAAGLSGAGVEYNERAVEDALLLGAFDDAIALLRRAETLALATLARLHARIDEALRRERSPRQ